MCGLLSGDGVEAGDWGPQGKGFGGGAGDLLDVPSLLSAVALLFAMSVWSFQAAVGGVVAHGLAPHSDSLACGIQLLLAGDVLAGFVSGKVLVDGAVGVVRDSMGDAGEGTDR